MKTSLKNSRGFASLIAIAVIALATIVVGYSAHKVGEISSEIKAFEQEQKAQEEQAGIDKVFGASLPSGAPVFETSLQSAIISTDSSMTLIANSVRGGGALSGWQCFTIDEGKTIREDVCGTISGTSVTGMTRGIDPLTATTTNSSLKFPHRVGAQVKQTDFPIIQIMRNQLNGSETLPNLLEYTSGQGCGVGSRNTNLCDKAYIDGVSVAGASDANTTTKGIVEIATSIETASSSGTGSTGATLVPANSMATSSPYTTGLYIPVTRNDGKISPLFQATTTTDNYVWGGTTRFNGTVLSTASTTMTATTTISATSATSNALILNNVPYSAPSSQGAAGTVLKNDGSGALSWGTPPHYNLVDTNDISPSSGYATSTLGLTIPANLLSASSTIEVRFTTSAACSSGSSGTCSVAIKNTSGAPLMSFAGIANDTSGNTSGDATGYFVVVTSNYTNFQAQAILGSSVQAFSDTAVGGKVFEISSTGTMDFTQAQTLKLVGLGTTASFTITSWSMIVTP